MRRYLLLLFLVLTSCSGGGGTPPPGLEILSVAPTGLIGQPGASITFSATVTGGPTGYAWTLGGGATPDTSSVPAPTVTLGAESTYSGQLIINTATETSAPFAFSYTVAIDDGRPIITAVTPSGEVGLARTQVQFVATATHTATSWEWTFPEGVTPRTSTEETPTVTLDAMNADGSTGSLIATNAIGPSLPFTFACEILPNVEITGVTPSGGNCSDLAIFSATGLDLDQATQWSWVFGAGATPWTTLAKEPSVRFLVPGTYQGSVWAQTATGTPSVFPFSYTVTGDCSIPHEVTLSTDPPTVDVVGAIAYADRPVIVDHTGTFADPRIRIAIASTAHPSSAADWTTVILGDGEPTGVTLYRGHLVIALVDDNAGLVELLIATPIEPTLPLNSADWTRITVVDLDGYYDAPGAVFVHDDRLCVDGQYLATPGLPTGPTDFITLPRQFVGGATSVEVPGEGPRIVGVGEQSIDGTYYVRRYQATTLVPATVDDYLVLTETTASISNTSLDSSPAGLGLWGGSPSYAYDIRSSSGGSGYYSYHRNLYLGDAVLTLFDSLSCACPNGYYNGADVTPGVTIHEGRTAVGIHDGAIRLSTTASPDSWDDFDRHPVTSPYAMSWQLSFVSLADGTLGYATLTNPVAYPDLRLSYGAITP